MNLILERAFNAILRIDFNLKVNFLSESSLGWLGVDSSKATRSLLNIVHTDDHKIVEEAVVSQPQHIRLYVRVVVPDAPTTRWVAVRASKMPVINQYLVCLLDISDFTPAVSTPADPDALQDYLTSLPNRRALTNLVNALTTKADKSFCLALLDLDGFKAVNDTMGHAAGDLVLVESARRLLTCLDTSRDTVARLGGDEFVLVLDDALDQARIDKIVSRVLFALSRPFNTDPQEAYIGCSIGLAKYPTHGLDYPKILNAADQAMYHAKRAGKNRVSTYEESVASDSFQLKAALHLAVQNGEFFLEYQPLFNAEKKLVGVEALMRWGSDSQSQVSPARFIPAAEDAGIMPYLGSWALKYACQDLKRLQKLAPGISVYVNVSSFQFKEEDFYDRVSNTLKEVGVSPSQLILEVKESIFAGGTKAELTLKRLGNLGVKFSIDNFGTGLSNFSNLVCLPIASIKLDRSLISNIHGKDNTKTKLVTSLISLVRSIGLTCVAEGIENETQFNILKGAQCEVFQGYHLGRPGSVDSVENSLSAANKKGEV